MTTEIASAHAPSTLEASRRAVLWPAVVAAGLGALLLYVVGFAAPHAIHEAAHDARHTLNFPCH